MNPDERKKLNEILAILSTRKELAYYIPIDLTADAGEELDYIKICILYILFDNEATMRERICLEELVEDHLKKS